MRRTILIILLGFYSSLALPQESIANPEEKQKPALNIAKGFIQNKGKDWVEIALDGQTRRFSAFKLDAKGVRQSNADIVTLLNKFNNNDFVAIQYTSEDNPWIEKIEKTLQSSKFEEEQRKKKAEITELFTKGLGYFNNNDFEEATKIWQTILVLDPRHKQANLYYKETQKKKSEVHLKNGEEYADKGKILDAITEWELALRANPIDGDMLNVIKRSKQKIILEHCTKASEYSSKNKLIEAIGEWNIVLSVNPQDATAKKGIEILNNRLKNVREEEKSLLQYESLTKKAEAAYNSGSISEALDLYLQAVKVTSDNSSAKLKIEEINRLMATSSKTLIESAQKCAEKREWLNTARNLRNCLKIDTNNKQAKEILKKYKSELMECRDDLYLDGLEAYGKEKIEEAIMDWKAVLIIDPEHQKAQLNISKASRKLNGRKK